MNSSINKPGFAIELKDKNGHSWSYRSPYGHTLVYDDEFDASKQINRIFKDPEIVEASIVLWKREVQFTKFNTDANYEHAKKTISEALLGMENVEKRKKVLKHFLDML